MTITQQASAHIQRLQEALAECRDHFTHCVQCDGGNDPDADSCMVCMINAALAAEDTEAEWCFMCDRPKNDCACVENGGNY